MENLKKKIKDLQYVVSYPYHLDNEWDIECDESFLKFLDRVTLALYVVVFGMPLLSFATLLMQNYGK